MDHLCYYRKCGTFVPHESRDARSAKMSIPERKQVLRNMMSKTLKRIYHWLFLKYLKLFWLEGYMSDYIFCWCTIAMHLIQTMYE